MAHVIEVPTGDPEDPSQRVLIEARIPVSSGAGGNQLVEASPVADKIVSQATRTLDQLMAQARPVAQSIVHTFRDMVDGPDEVTAEFGVALTASADAVITKATGEATIALTLTWLRTPEAP